MSLVVLIFEYAVCPGGEGAALKAVGRKRLAGSNPVDGANYKPTYNQRKHKTIIQNHRYLTYNTSQRKQRKE